MVPKPGRMPSQLEATMNMKMVMTRGKNVRALLLPGDALGKVQEEVYENFEEVLQASGDLVHAPGGEVSQDCKDDDREPRGEHGVGELPAGE